MHRKHHAVGTSLILIVSAMLAASVRAAPNTAINGSLDGSELLKADLNGDCVIDIVDVMFAVDPLLGDALRGQPDQDGDGVVTANDTVVAIRKAVYLSFGDANADGVVDVQDVMMVLYRIGDPLPSLIEADVDLDGVVSINDLSIVMSRQGDMVRLPRAADAVDRIFLALGSFREVGRDAFLRNCGTGGADPCDHSQGISGSYPSSHGTIASWNYPDNHLRSISSGWDLPPENPGGGHGVWASGESGWPGNHVAAASQTWNSPPPGPHVPATSSGSAHSTSISRQQWHFAPGHRSDISVWWPNPHEQIVSRSYPPNHDPSLSRQRQFTPHRRDISDSWGDRPHNPQTSSGGMYNPVHGLEFSSTWPRNHEPLVSATWPGRSHHDVATSAAWPTNHVVTMSQSWPPSTIPQWPASHSGQCSNSWGAPPPVQFPLFPENHDQWTTATSLLPLIPIVFP